MMSKDGLDVGDNIQERITWFLTWFLGILIDIDQQMDVSDVVLIGYSSMNHTFGSP